MEAKFRFPVVDTQSGGLQTISVEVLEEVEVETPGGKFATFKVKVNRPDGEAYLYLRKDSPHFMVKQEVPAQALTMELKSVDK